MSERHYERFIPDLLDEEKAEARREIIDVCGKGVELLLSLNKKHKAIEREIDKRIEESQKPEQP